MSENSNHSPNRLASPLNHANNLARISDENEINRILLTAANNSNINDSQLNTLIIASRNPDIVPEQLGLILTLIEENNSNVTDIHNMIDALSTDTLRLTQEERIADRDVQILERENNPAPLIEFSNETRDRLASAIYNIDNNNNLVRTSDAREITRILHTAANNLSISLSLLESLVIASQHEYISPAQLGMILTSIENDNNLDIVGISAIIRNYIAETEALTEEEDAAQRHEHMLQRENNPQPLIELTDEGRVRLMNVTTNLDADNSSNSSRGSNREINSSRGSINNSSSNSNTTIDENNYSTDEPQYDRELMINLLNMDFNFTLDQFIEHRGLSSCSRCIKFIHTPIHGDIASIDEGGLAKEWFLREYTSLAIIKYINKTPNILDSDANYRNFQHTIGQIILLGYLNFNWLNISNDLLDLLFISYIMYEYKYKKNGEIKENLSVDLYMYEFIFKKYLKYIATNELTNYELIKTVEIPRSIKNVVEYMYKKINNQCNPNQINFINRDHLIAFLYYLEHIEWENDEYLLKIIKTLYNQSKEQFTDDLQYIDEDLNTDTLENFEKAVKARISNEIDFEIFINLNTEIYDVLYEFLPKLDSINSAYNTSRADTYPNFFNNYNRRLIYAHLINNEIIDVVKLKNNIHFEMNEFAIDETYRFMQALDSMTNDELINFLKFVTGTDKIPQKIEIMKTTSTFLAAHTCSNTLEIPPDFLSANNGIESIKIALTAELTNNEFNMAGGEIIENNTMSSIVNSIFLGGIVLISSILQGM